MAGLHWYTIVLIISALLSSAVLGFLLHFIIAANSHKLQRIGRRVDFLTKFNPPLGASLLPHQITLSDGENQYKFEQISVADIHFNNQGTQDFEELNLRLTLSEKDAAIYIESHSSDRSHEIEQLTFVNFAEPKSEIDFILRPLNRGDSYSLRLLIISSEPLQEPGQINFSSPQAVEFVHLPTITEVLEKTAASTSIAIGPFNLSFDNK